MRNMGGQTVGALVMMCGLTGRQILVIEDEFLIAADLCCALHLHGAHVVGPTGNFDQAFELATCAVLDGALVNIKLAHLLSYPIVECLMARRVPFLLLTGYDGTALPDAFQTCPRLTKPVPAELAVKKLRDILSYAGGTGSRDPGRLPA